ncbi:MAG TPA: CHRD domain-containing protein [Acidobacteriota bacterium]|nr:CHRD domain-containing protein [Acidobacteriota bacterium]
MRRPILLCLLLAVMIPVMPAKGDHEDHDNDKISARLTGFQEVPAILSDGKADFTATLDQAGTMLTYSLTFSGLSAPATASHIHIGQRGVSGGVMAFLCGGGGKPACPASGGTVTGTIVAADIIGPATQGVHPGDFAGFLRVLRSRNAYANIHTSNFPAGEIRGQIEFED